MVVFLLGLCFPPTEGQLLDFSVAHQIEQRPSPFLLSTERTQEHTCTSECFPGRVVFFKKNYPIRERERVNGLNLCEFCSALASNRY